MALPPSSDPPLINLAELNPAVHKLECILSCSTCHEVSDDLQVHDCGGTTSNYCQTCCSQLSHCIACDEPLNSTKPSLSSLSNILSVNAARFGGRAPQNILRLLQQVVNHDDLRLVDRNSSGGQVYFGGNLSRKCNSSGRVGRIKYQNQQHRKNQQQLANERFTDDAPTEDLDFHALQEEASSSGNLIVLEDRSRSITVDSFIKPAEKEDDQQSGNEDNTSQRQKKRTLETTPKPSPSRSRKRRRRSSQQVKAQSEARRQNKQVQQIESMLSLPSTNDFLSRIELMANDGSDSFTGQESSTTANADEQHQSQKSSQLQSSIALLAPGSALYSDDNGSVAPEQLDHSMTQHSSSSLSFASLPNTVDFVQRLKALPLETKPSIRNDSQLTVAPASVFCQQEDKELIAVSTIRSMETTKHDSRIASNVSNTQWQSQASSNISSSFTSLPGTMDFERKLEEMASPSLAKEPSQTKNVDNMLTVAVETVSQKRAETFQEMEASGKVRFVPRICRSAVDLEGDDDGCKVLPSHFLVESSHQNKTCSRTFEYLKAMALGIYVVDLDWMVGREVEGDEMDYLVWGDSQIWQKVAQVKEDNRCPYAWLKSATWWRSNHGPCFSAAKSRSDGNSVPLLAKYQVYVLPSCHDNQDVRLLQAEETELLCLLTGAESLLSLLDEDRGCFNRHGEQQIVIVPEHVTKKSLMRVLSESNAKVPVDAKLHQRGGTANWNDDEKQAIVIRESWLIDTVSADTIAPVSLYCLGFLRW